MLEDPGGESPDGFLSGAMEMTTQFLRVAVGLFTALGGLHERKLVHKDVKAKRLGRAGIREESVFL